MTGVFSLFFPVLLVVYVCVTALLCGVGMERVSRGLSDFILGVLGNGLCPGLGAWRMALFVSSIW